MEIKLTQTVQKGGCAAKVAASELRKILAQVQFPPKHPQLLVDGGLFDDAAIYKVTDDIAMVQTLDFFTPILDSPYKFGAVAAANSLSDVYAMGGRPKTCMAILAFPLATMDSEVVVQVMQGACDKIKESLATLVGGHSIDDDTLKFGLSVTGFVDPKKVWSNSGCQAEDDLILTKAIGTGTLTAALKRGEVSEDEISEAIDSMSQLNNIMDFLPEKLLSAIHSATDITGFGLIGHAMQMAKASEKQIQIHLHQIPVFERAKDLLSKGFLTKAHRTNKEYSQNSTNVGVLSEAWANLVCDPQTSGGLLLSVDPKHSEEILQILQRTKNKMTAKIGTVKSFSAKVDPSVEFIA